MGFATVPVDILRMIFAHLSISDLKACETVCRLWRDVALVVQSKRRWNLLTLRRMRWVDGNHCDQGSESMDPRFAHAVCLHPDGSMYAFGFQSWFDDISDLWKFELTTRKWQKVDMDGDIPESRSYCSLTVYDNKLWLLRSPFRLFDCFEKQKNSELLIHIADLTSRTWKAVPTKYGPISLVRHSCSIMMDKWMVVCGTEISVKRFVRVLDMSTMKWFYPKVDCRGPEPECSYTQVALDEKHILIICDSMPYQFPPIDRYPNEIWLLNVGSRLGVWTWRLVTLRNTDLSPTYLLSRQSCKIGNNVVALGCLRNVKRCRRSRSSKYKINRGMSMLCSCYDEILTCDATVANVHPQHPYSFPKSCFDTELPIQLFVLDLEHIITECRASWTAIPAACNAPLGAFSYALLAGRHELICFGGLEPSHLKIPGTHLVGEILWPDNTMWFLEPYHGTDST